MPEYVPPIRDARFVLEEICELSALTKLEPFQHLDPDTAFGVLEEGGRFMAEVMSPLNRVGDTVGSRLNDDGSVTTPPGFQEAYRQYVEAGWPAVGSPQEFGGGGFPWSVVIPLQEMFNAANLGFSLGPLLTHGTIDLLHLYGTAEQQATYLENLVAGKWSGTMELTEPEAGSDVGALRTRAVPTDDGTWRISGQKIFITYGEHDLTDNIIHLVLARLPEAPPGTRGISCFIVPKYLVNADGSLGAPNDVRCVSIEHKLGIHASPTCVMSYGDEGGAVGYLIGEPNRGMRYMFTMMNSARIAVGVQGLAVADRAYQAALSYAQERRQGQVIGGTSSEQAPIVEHPDVRRMLLTMKAYIEAMRCVLYINAACIDLAHCHDDPEVRQARQDMVELLTPVSKAWSTDLAVEITSLALQVHGGMGYVEETGVAQYYRDSRIGPIYEGTNGIQAMDLVGRKLPMRGGGVVNDYLSQIDALDGELASGGEELASIRVNLAAAAGALRGATNWIFEHGLADPNDALAGATPYLRMFGLVTGGWLLARSALAARRLLTEGRGSKEFLEEKMATAQFYAEQLLPQAAALGGAVTAGAKVLYKVDLSHAVPG